MPDFKQLFQNRDKFYALADSAQNSIGRLLFGVALARLAGVDQFAHYVLLLSVQVILQNISATLHTTPMINHATGLPGSRREGLFQWVHGQVAKFVLWTGVLLLPGLLIFSVAGIGWPVALAFIFTTLVSIETNFQRARLQALFRMRVAVYSDFICIGVSVTALLAAWRFFDAPHAGFWWGTAFGNAAAAVLMRRVTRFSGLVDAPSAVDSLQFKRDGHAMLRGSIANSFCSRVQPVVLKLVGGVTAVASFGAVWTLIGPFRMVSGGLSGLLRPRLAIHLKRGDFGAYRRLLLASLSILGTIGGAGLLVAFVAGTQLTVLVFGEAFRSAGFLIPIAVAYGLLDAATTVMIVALQVRHTNGASLASRYRIEAAVISLVILVPAAYQFGAMGAFAALLVAESCYLFRAISRLGSDFFPFTRSQSIPLN